MLSKPAQWQHMQRYHSFIVEMLLTPVISYFPTCYGPLERFKIKSTDIVLAKVMLPKIFS